MKTKSFMNLLKSRHIHLFIFLLINTSLFAQAPQKMSYQAVIRNNSNVLVISSPVGMKISLLQNTANGVVVYSETQSTNTNTNGLVSLEIGSGTVVSGSFVSIDWSAGPYFIKTETDPLGGINYTISGTSQLLSVPYALYAANSGSSTPGPQGPIGLTGPEGVAGPTGPQGTIGLTGANGIDGTDGTTGQQGPIGLTGLTGPQGPIGATGPQGPAGSTNGWALLGNSGTVDGTNFIGTTDSVALNFKVFNQKAGKIDLSYYNTFLGFRSGNSITSLGILNTGFGYQSLYSNTGGDGNVAIGYRSLYTNTVGTYNVGIGRDALYSNVGGDQNTAIGDFALKFNTASKNTAVGQYALVANTTGLGNSALGWSALTSNTVGNFNTALGYQSLQSNTIGNGNTALGYISLQANTTGINNTAIGYNSLSNNTTGQNNTAIGYNAVTPLATASNQVRIGNTLVTYAGVQVALTITSDRRWKSDIQNSNLGLDFINKLRPVSYYRTNDESKKLEYGFIAQEVEEALSISGVQNNGIISKDDEGMYGVRYNDFISPMVKAIQEQQILIEKQQKQIDELNNKINELINK